MDSVSQYRRFFDSAKDGILLLDARTALITDINPFLAQLLGYLREEVVGRAFSDLVQAADAEAAQARLLELKAKSYIHYDDLPLQTSDGSVISVETSGNAYRVRGEEVIQFNIRDIRHRKDVELTEQRLRHAHKMEAVGRLAGGVAHDFNNLLGVIVGYCELMEAQDALPDAMRGMLVQIHDAGKTAKHLTQRLLEFSRGQGALPVTLDLNETVNNIQSMLSRLIGDDVALVSALCPGLAPIKADSSQVEQVLMNLVINARDAMPTGGSITLQTANIELHQTPARVRPQLPPGRYIELTVTDTGMGMGTETLSQIFEPFFTTKGPGHGSGLGLATVLDIVQQSGGGIGVQSQPGYGASFAIYFPRCEETPESGKQQPASRSRGGTETILLVDDADALRQLTRRLLEERGYTVVEASSPTDALQKAAQHRGPIPLMITDVVMPGFSGFALADKLARFRSETKVLYASGYSQNVTVPPPLAGQLHAFLEKPFSREDLLSKVRELLDSTTTVEREKAPIFVHC
jgi:two-component system, cell cycle sensor histidine kinase and response regulator CckA